MKQSKTTMKELTRRYRAVLIKCALLNLAAFSVAMPAKADVVIGDGDTAIYTRISKKGEGEEKRNRYTIKVNNNNEEFFNFSPDALKMTGGNLIVESKVGDWLDWQGTGGIDISGGTVSAKNEETLSSYRGPVSISGNAVINTAMMSNVNTTISGGRITLADTNDANRELYFGKGLGIDAADEQTSGTLSISGGDITLGKNRYIVLLREWGDDDTENLPAAYHGDIKISGGNITLNKNAQIIRTDNDNNEVGKTLVFNYLKDSRPNELSKTTGEIDISGGTVTLNDTASIVNHSSDGTIRISDAAIINVNGNNRFENAKGIAAADFTGGEINLNGALTANIAATGGTIVFGKETARLNGDLSGSNVDLIFKDNYALSNLNNKATLKNITIADGKTLDIGTGMLTADLISGGTISAILTDAAKTSAIVNATAQNATLKLDMSNASRDAVTEYKITNGVGFTFGDYATNRYAVSDSEFDIAAAKTLEKLSNWKGGNLWILRLATASEAAIEDLEKSGVVLPESEKQASKILDLANEVLNKLPEHTQKIIEKVNDLLDKAAGKTAEVRQILKEVAPDTAQSGSKMATSTAKSVINVVGSRFGGGMKSGGSSAGAVVGGRGRSGGDYAAGRSSVWAQGMMNYAKLDKEDGFNAHSNGFAAGAEINFTDSFKAGIGYAYTSGDISTDRAQTDVDTHTGFVYGEYKPHKAYVNGVVSYGRSKYDEKTRTVGLTSDYNADTIAAQIAAGYDLGLLTPEAAVRFTNVRLKEYTDAAGATLRDKTQNTWTGVAGIKAAKGYHLTANPKINFTPELKVAATYDFARDDENRTVVLPDHSSYVVSGDPMKRFGVETGAGLTVTFGNSSELSVSYEGKFKDHYKDHTGMVNLKVNF